MDTGELRMPPTQFDAIATLIETVRDDFKTFRREVFDRLDRRDAEHDRQIREIHARVDHVVGRVASLEETRHDAILATDTLASQAQARTALSLTRRQWLAIILPLGLAALGGPGNVFQAFVTAGRFLIGGQP